MQVLTRKAITALSSALRQVQIGEFTAHLKPLNGLGRAEFVKRISELKDDAGLVGSTEVKAWLVAASLVDGDGAPVYGDGDTAALIAEMDCATLETLFSEALQMNGLDAKAGERALGNSTPTQS